METRPTKIVAVAKNYRLHAREMGGNVPKEPKFFLKPPSSIIGDGETIILPKISERVDYEVELAAVVSKRCSKVTPEEAKNYILGYSIVIDVTARDLQSAAKKAGMPWTVAKGFDTFAPFGPKVVPASEIDPSNLDIWLKVGGKYRQRGNTKDMVFNTYELVSYISNIMTLEPMDIIATGTPDGVGAMKDGDEIEAGIEGIGTLKVRARCSSAD